jgi:hypothetical protein
MGPDLNLRLPPELWQELAAWLTKARCYLDEDEWPAGFSETMIAVEEGKPTDNPDLAWAHHHVRNGRAVACLSLVRRGPHPTWSSLGTAVVHWVKEEEDSKKFWRNAIILEGDREDTIVRLAVHAYPDLFFCGETWEGLRRLASGYLAIRAEIQRYLSVFNDAGRWAFTFPPPALTEDVHSESNQKPSAQLIEKRFKLLRLDVSPEKPNVYHSIECRRSREINIYGRVLYCEWHGKLEPHRNRIYIHPPVHESKGKVIVAIFDEHLPTPGG